MLTKTNKMLRNFILLIIVTISLKSIDCRKSYNEHLMHNEKRDIEENIPTADTKSLRQFIEKHFSKRRNHVYDNEEKQKVGDEIKKLFESYNLKTVEHKFDCVE